jgi:hypothetical protein
MVWFKLSRPFRKHPRRRLFVPATIPRGPIGFRLAHELHGLLSGLRADGVIKPLEHQRLQDWLDANREYTDVRPFTELAAHIEAALADDLLTVDECDDLLFVVCKLTTVNPYFDAFREGIQRLMGLLDGVVADHEFNEREARAIVAWVQEWSHLKGLWPYDECESIVTGMLEKNRLTHDFDHLRALARQFPIASIDRTTGEQPQLVLQGICAVDPTIIFVDRSFVFTGESQRHSRTELEASVLQRGGRHHDNVRKDTDYLVVCDGGSQHWAFSCYGRKVEKAYNLRRDGHRIAIVHEADFHHALN